MSLIPQWLVELAYDIRLEYRIDRQRNRCAALLAEHDYPAAREEFAVLGLLCRQHRAAHCDSTFENALRFVLWVHGLSRQPTVDDIRTRWGCSRATAYRYLNRWRAAACLPTEDTDR